MKTTKKALVGLLFLVPLLLPATTRAGGGLEGWFRDFFRRDNNREIRPTPGGYGYDRNPYRQYDPHHAGNGGRRGSTLGDPSGSGNSVPIDGGLIFLTAAGLMLGIMKVYGQKKPMTVPLG